MRKIKRGSGPRSKASKPRQESLQEIVAKEARLAKDLFHAAALQRTLTWKRRPLRKLLVTPPSQA